MVALLRKDTNIWCLIIHCLAFVALSIEESAPVKRDTTLDNVKAMYNRFITMSTGKAKYVTNMKKACNIEPPPSILKSPGLVPVAASQDDFQSSLGCGVCLEILGSGKAAAPDLYGSPAIEGAFKGIIVDENDSLNQGDLAFLPPASGSGLWEINFKAMDCPTGLGPTGNIQFRFTGSNEMYFKLKAMNSKVPVVGIEAWERVHSKWYCLTRTLDDFFSSEGMGAVSFPLKVRLTSIMNEHLEAIISNLINDVVIKSDIQFSDTSTRGGSPEGITCYGQGNRADGGQGDIAFCVSKEDGIYSDPEDATAFYICEGEKSKKQFCPNGLKFNPLISSCDVPAAGDANYAGNINDPTVKLNAEENKWAKLSDKYPDNHIEVGSNGDEDNGRKDENGRTGERLLSINIFKSPSSYSSDHNPQRIKAVTTAAESSSENPASSMLEPESKTRQQYQEYRGTAESRPISHPRHRAQNAEFESNINSHESDQQNNVPVQDGSSLNLAREKEGQRAERNITNSDHDKHLDGIVSDKDDSQFFAGTASLKQININESHYAMPPTMHDGGYLHQGDPITPHHKLLAINIYHHQPDSLDMENPPHIKTRLSESTGIMQHKVESHHVGTESNQAVALSPADFQSDENEILNTPGVKSEYEYEQENPYSTWDSRPVNDDVNSVNESAPEHEPLQFKLHINMDDNAEESVINCTIYRCSENETKPEDERAQKQFLSLQERPTSVKGEETQTILLDTNQTQISATTNEGKSGSSVTLKTEHSVPSVEDGEVKVFPAQIPRPQVAESSEPKFSENANKNLYGTNSSPSSSTAHSSYGPSATSEAHTITQVHYTNRMADTTNIHDRNDEMKTQENELAINQEGSENLIHTQKPMETTTVTNSKNSLDSTNVNEREGSSARPYGTMKDPQKNEISALDVHISNENKLRQRESSTTNNAFLSSKNVSFPSEERNGSVSESGSLGSQVQNMHQLKLQQYPPLPIRLEKSSGFTFLSKNTTSYNERYKDLQYDVNATPSKQNTGQNDTPQLKIVLKSPGKISSPLNNTMPSLSSLRRRSESRGHIVQVLRSLIDRPPKVGSTKKDIASKLSTIVKPRQGATRGDVTQSQMDSQSFKESGNIAESILEANKEFLDDVAMQGMLFSDGDPEETSIPDIVSSQTLEQPTKSGISDNSVTAFSNNGLGPHSPQGPKLQQPSSINAFPLKSNSTAQEIISLKLKKTPLHPSQQQDWVDAEQLISQMKNGKVTSSEANQGHTSGSSSLSDAPDSDGSGGLVDVQMDDDKNAVSVTVGQYSPSEVNAFKGGILRLNVNPRLKLFCYRRPNGVYSNPFDRKSFMLCANGATEERECPNPMLFNNKEKICDLPGDGQENKPQEEELTAATVTSSPLNFDRKSVEKTNVPVKVGNKLRAILSRHEYKRNRKSHIKLKVLSEKTFKPH